MTGYPQTIRVIEMSNADQWSGLIERIDPGYAPLIKSLVRWESDGDRFAVSRVGAKGLLQLMPFVYGDSDPFDPEVNISIGSSHLRWIQDWFHDRFPSIMPPSGRIPSDPFALRVLLAGWVKGFAAGKGIADELAEYQGHDWAEFVSLYPEWATVGNWIDKVARSAMSKQTGVEIARAGFSTFGLLLVLGLIALLVLAWRAK